MTCVSSRCVSCVVPPETPEDCALQLEKIKVLKCLFSGDLATLQRLFDAAQLPCSKLYGAQVTRTIGVDWPTVHVAIGVVDRQLLLDPSDLSYRVSRPYRHRLLIIQVDFGPRITWLGFPSGMNRPDRSNNPSGSNSPVPRSALVNRCRLIGSTNASLVGVAPPVLSLAEFDRAPRVAFASVGGGLADVYGYGSIGFKKSSDKDRDSLSAFSYFLRSVFARKKRGDGETPAQSESTYNREQTRLSMNALSLYADAPRLYLTTVSPTRCLGDLQDRVPEDGRGEGGRVPEVGVG
nr:hypothetical protein Iba_chr06cCG6220 [Ipomoea batatas]